MALEQGIRRLICHLDSRLAAHTLVSGVNSQHRYASLVRDMHVPFLLESRKFVWLEMVIVHSKLTSTHALTLMFELKSLKKKKLKEEVQMSFPMYLLWHVFSVSQLVMFK